MYRYKVKRKDGSRKLRDRSWLDGLTGDFYSWTFLNDPMCAHLFLFFWVTCLGVLQWEESMGGSGAHAQSAHRVPLPTHQLQQIQGPVGRHRHSVMHCRRTTTHQNVPHWMSMCYKHLATRSLPCLSNLHDGQKREWQSRVCLQLTPSPLRGRRNTSQIMYLFIYRRFEP